MRNLLIVCALIIFNYATLPAQDTTAPTIARPVKEYAGQVYKIKPRVDIPLTTAAAAWTLYSFSRVTNKEASTATKILSLKKDNINWFDRWAVHKYSEHIDNTSYIPFYISMPLPVLFLADKKMRKDFLKLIFLYSETMSVTGTLYSSAAHYTNRLRPYTYTAETPLEKRTAANSKNSFFAGHVALVATSTFFMAKVYADYHPESKLKWVFYGTAIAATGLTAYLRNRAGMHFPSDILVGTAVGTISGLLVPSLHKNKLLKNPHLSILPFGGQCTGLIVLYNI
jgi:membrane-associated phospholipid phosphatase